MINKFKFNAEIVCPFCGHLNSRFVKVKSLNPPKMLVICCNDKTGDGCGRFFTVQFFITIESKIFTLQEHETVADGSFQGA